MADMVKRKDFLENEVVDLTEEIKLVSPTDTPLTTMLMGRGAVEPATDITVTWRERELNSKYMRADLNETIERLNKLENKDGAKWEKFKWLIVAGLVTIVLGYLAVSVGLK